MPTVASLCSGYGGLDLGLALKIGPVDHQWFAEIDPAPAAVLAARFPKIPNLGDLATIDYSTLIRPDWLTAGFPCQPASQAGKQKGMDDDRWLWDEVARAVAGLRPRHVLLENVLGLLTVDGGRPFERVICDLAALGYVGSWGVVRASEAGAPHRRERVFIRALDAHADEQSRDLGTGLRAGESGGIGRGRPHDLHAQTPADADGTGLEGRGSAVRDPAQEPAHDGAVPDTYGSGRALVGGQQSEQRDADRRDSENTAWRDYEPAVRYWERVIGRPAPRPVLDAPSGARHLNPRFVEWMHGLDDGWVTAVPGLDREDCLRVLGNGVCPRQAALAVPLLAVTREAVAA